MPEFKVAVIIPTKNAMPGFRDVLECVARQKTPWNYEIIVIDSGSKDGTVDLVRRFSNVRLIEIDPQSFGHGRTRNQAIEQADAEFLALLTHDALPASEIWLKTMVEAAEQDERIAGVFGRHIAYAHASPFVKKDLDDHFQGFLNHPLIVHRDLDPHKYADDEGWRQFLHFYSDNNSLMRKSVWEKFPYPDVEFAEDQIWARTIIEAGYSKAYAPEAIVIHSHDYGIVEQLRRAFDEARNFKKYFGYRLSQHPLGAGKAMIKLAFKALVEKIDPSIYGAVSFRDRLKRAAQRVALVSGHFLGANYEKLPTFITERLSLDNRLYKS